MTASQINTELSQGGSSGGGGAVTEADGANVALGAIADAAVTGDVVGSLSAKLRGISKMIADVWDNVNHKLNVVSVQSGTWTVAQGPPAAVGSAWPVRVSDGVRTAVVTAASTAAAATDTALVAALSPNSPVPAGTNIIGKVGIDQTTPGTTNGVQVNAALPAGANLIGKVGIDQTTPGTTNQVFETANKWADPANRQYFTLSCVHIAGVTVEALLSCVANTNGVAAGAATSFTVPVGKTLRLTSLHVECHNTSTVASLAEVTVRAVPPAGSLAVTSPIIARGLAQVIGALAANAGADDISIPEGVCLPAGAIVGASQLCPATTCNVSIVLVGYLY